MATYVDLDSILRDREAYPNPADYKVVASQIKSWFGSARSVRAFPQDPNIKPLEFATSVQIRYLTIPYTEAFAILPRLYVVFKTSEYNDIHLLQTISGKHPDANFICEFDRLQFDINGNPVWIHFKCKTRQVMRFKRDSPVTFQVYTRDGNILPNIDTLVPVDPDPLKQILCTIEVVPYIRDTYFSNHMTELMQ